MPKGRLIIFSAPSGSGKTTIVRHLLGLDLSLEFSISATNRPKRKNEVEGRDYYFMTTAAFKHSVANGEFLEWEEVYENTFYGTLKREVERIRRSGSHVIFDVDVLGGMNIKKYYGNEVLAIFVQTPSIEELEKRLTARSTDSDEVIRRRIAKAEYELTFANKFDVILINDQLEVALSEAEEVVTNFLNRTDK